MSENKKSSTDLVLFAIFTGLYMDQKWLDNLKQYDKQAYYFLKNDYRKGE